MTRQRFTLVSFHAHPDDESLLTGGTLAMAAHDGHRVVLVTATDGEQGLAAEADGVGSHLAERRREELERAASALGCARLVRLGYGDSGLHADADDMSPFAQADVETAARRLAEILIEEQADALTIYDAQGGYGHPDHVQVHRVGTRAARLAGTALVLEATVDRELLERVLKVVSAARSAFGVFSALGRDAPLGRTGLYTSRRLITHRINVSRHVGAKRSAMAAHHSQQRADGQVRVLWQLLRLPGPVFRLAFGREWFVEQGRRPGHLEGDLFASLRHQPRRRTAASDLRGGHGTARS